MGQYACTLPFADLKGRRVSAGGNLFWHSLIFNAARKAWRAQAPEFTRRLSSVCLCMKVVREHECMHAMHDRCRVPNSKTLKHLSSHHAHTSYSSLDTHARVCRYLTRLPAASAAKSPAEDKLTNTSGLCRSFCVTFYLTFTYKPRLRALPGHHFGRSFTTRLEDLQQEVLQRSQAPWTLTR